MNTDALAVKLDELIALQRAALYLAASRDMLEANSRSDCPRIWITPQTVRDQVAQFVSVANNDLRDTA